MADSIFKRLVRFEDHAGQAHYGEVPKSHNWADNLVGVSVPVYTGGLPWKQSFCLSTDTVKIAKVLSPIEAPPFIYGIGLNYRKHAEEAKVEIPPYPLIFFKGGGSVSGPYEDVPVHKEADFMDYEASIDWGELTIVFGKQAVNLTESDNVFDYLLGYTVGNDVSSRLWQDPTRSGGQHGYAKAFDKFTVIGSILASTSYVPDPSKLTLKTTVNGEQRQLSQTDDLIFDIPSIVRHLTRGRTIRPGTVVMTGTPSGVAAFHKPPAWLKDGDVVEVEVTEIGRIRKRMAFPPTS
ncbi:hypothetical protein Z517_05773 [Fonsecaea pedrosoi CBS 271.37]|uniref:Fumarylacetoacetase-like C-terminal domain-containing protein n=1 Tax=Fonsecaea pedrosoi CBS 271.37 TaxID=1442368 RepID=A0A0D2DN81_9EURO|nr:uncharacterized protein Z517_05773 [Fonsecaea pedrosoi CBS 271.37]KIW79161.1 hypothetical protein Z517_05773 [Fonsecaea pedrosoi CBS 271.37]